MTPSAKIIVYGHPACLMVGPVLAMLKQCQIEFEYINIFNDPQARETVREINNGNESVPTLVFPDGSTLTEPTGGQLRSRLEADGYDVPLKAQLVGNALPLAFLVLLILLVLRIMGVI